MKNQLLKTSLILLSVVFSLTSCSSDDDGGSGGAAAAGTMKATIDGANYQSSEMLSSANKVSAGGGSTFTLLGNTNEGKTINLLIQGYEGVGTYEIGGDNFIGVTASYIEVNVNSPADSQTWQAPFDETVSGSISVSSDDGQNVQGTFEFTGQSSTNNTFIEVTNGSFNMDYTSF